MTAAETNNLPEWMLDIVSYLALGCWVYWAFLIVGGGSLALLLIDVWRSR